MTFSSKDRKIHFSMKVNFAANIVCACTEVPEHLILALLMTN